MENIDIKWQLSEVMEDRRIGNQQLHQSTGLHLVTISKLRNKKPARLDMNTLSLLCRALDCQPGELVRYEGSEEK